MKCQRCGAGNGFQKHHIIPLSKGGDDSFLNRIVLCIDCHLKIHHHGVGRPHRGGSLDHLDQFFLTPTPKVRRVKVLGGWRLTIPAQIWAQAKVEEGDPFLAGWNEATRQITYTRLRVEPVGGTLF